MTGSPRSAGGFTLLELTAAIAILVFGVTSLIGVLGLGVASRRGAEMRSQAVLLVDRIVQEVREYELPKSPLPEEWSDSDDLAIPEIEVSTVQGYPGLAYRVEFDTDVEQPDLVLARIAISWLDQGAEQALEFERVLPRETPFSERVRARRKN